MFYTTSLVSQIKNKFIRSGKHFSFFDKLGKVGKKNPAVIKNNNSRYRLRKNLIFYFLLSFFLILRKQEILKKNSTNLYIFNNKKVLYYETCWFSFEKKICIGFIFHFIQMYPFCDCTRTLEVSQTKNFFKTVKFIKERTWCYKKLPRKKNKIFNLKPFVSLNKNESKTIKTKMNLLTKKKLENKTIYSFMLNPRVGLKKKANVRIFLSSKVNYISKGIFFKKKGKFVKSFLNFYVSKLPNKLYSYRIKKNFQLPIRNIVLGLLSLKNTTKFKWENLVGFLYFFNLKMKKKCQA